MHMSESRTPKKSETLEIRLPFPTKQAFMAHCRAEGRSASQELRGFIERRLEPRTPVRSARRLHQIIAVTLIAAAVGTAAAPALARATRMTTFENRDTNSDGVLTRAEFVR